MRSQEPFKTKKNCPASFSQFAVSANCHFINFILHQNPILSTCHYVYYLFLSKCHFTTISIIYFYQSVILSTCQYMYFLLYNNDVSTTGSIFNLPFYLLVVSSNCHYVKLQFHQNAIQLIVLSTSHFIYLFHQFNQNGILSSCQNINLPFYQLPIC